jgi:hypothetical protein
MAGIVGVTPVPVAVVHDPLGRAMTEEQKAKLQEQPSPPLEQTQHKERIADRREPPRRRRRDADDDDDDDDDGPGQIIDSYA